MDELELLRGLDPDRPRLTGKTRGAARERLMDEIAAARPRRPRVPAVRVVAAVLTGIALLAAGLALALAFDTAPSTPEDEEMIAVPSVSAGGAGDGEAEQEQPPIPRRNQYLYTKEIIEERPTDGQGPTETFVDESWRSVDGSRPSQVSERGNVMKSAPLAKNQSLWPPTDYAKLEALPTDPETLLQGLRLMGRPPAEPVPLSDNDYEKLYLDLTFLLGGFRVMPPGLRTAAFEAVRLIPGVDIAPDDVVTGERAAYGIHRPNSVYAYTIVVDRDIYEYLGKHGTITIDDREVQQVIRLVDSGVVDEIGQRLR